MQSGHSVWSNFSFLFVLDDNVEFRREIPPGETIADVHLLSIDLVFKTK